MNKIKSSSYLTSQTTLLLVILLGIAGWFGIGIPLYNSCKEKAIQSQQQQRLLAKNLRVIARKATIEEASAKIPAVLKSSQTNAQEIAQFQNVITDLAKQTGVKVQKTKTRPIETDLISKTIWIELDCQGRILQLSDFIYRMQSAPEAIQVKQLRISLQNEKNSILRATLLVTKLLISD